MSATSLEYQLYRMSTSRSSVYEPLQYLRAEVVIGAQ